MFRPDDDSCPYSNSLKRVRFMARYFVFTLGCLFFLDNVTAHPSGSQNAELDAELAPLVAALDANCVKCYGSTPDQLINAIRELEEYAKHNETPREVKIKLARAKRSYALTYLEPESKVYVDFMRSSKQSYEQYLSEKPLHDEIDVALEYSDLLETKERIDVIDKILFIDPDHVAALYTKGALLYFGEIDAEQGVELMEKAVASAHDDLKISYGYSLLHAYQQEGRTEDAERLEKELSGSGRDSN